MKDDREAVIALLEKTQHCDISRSARSYLNEALAILRRPPAEVRPSFELDTKNMTPMEFFKHQYENEPDPAPTVPEPAAEVVKPEPASGEGWEDVAVQDSSILYAGINPIYCYPGDRDFIGYVFILPDGRESVHGQAIAWQYQDRDGKWCLSAWQDENGGIAVRPGFVRLKVEA